MSKGVYSVTHCDTPQLPCKIFLSLYVCYFVFSWGKGQRVDMEGQKDVVLGCMMFNSPRTNKNWGNAAHILIILSTLPVDTVLEVEVKWHD